MTTGTALADMKPVKNPRKIGKHVSAALDEIKGAGGYAVEVVKTKHVRITWLHPALPDLEMEIRTSSTPRCADMEARRLLRGIREWVSWRFG